MKKIVLAALLLSSVAYAQPGEPKKEATVDNIEGKTEPVDPDPSQHFNYTNTDWRGKDEYGGKYGDGTEVNKQGVELHEEEPMSPPFMWMLVNFGLFLVILGKWGWPAIRKLAEDRHDQIKDALDEAAELRDQAKHKLDEYETRIKDVDAEIKSLVEGIRKDAEADKARILAAAAVQAEQMKRDAELRIAAEIEQARAQLTEEVSAAAAAAASKIVRERSTADDQNKLVSSFINGMAS